MTDYMQKWQDFRGLRRNMIILAAVGLFGMTGAMFLKPIFPAMDELDRRGREPREPHRVVALSALRKIFLRRPRRVARIAELVTFSGAM